MQIVSTTEELREQLSDWRHAGDHVALVPTMGNLHEGHLSLVRLAHEHAERVVVSIFVNPTQFAEGEDLANYPRTLERDKRRLTRAKADLIFVPDDDTLYPFGIDNATSVTVPVLTDDLCGSVRPGHFDGVTTVVSRLFMLIQPDVAIFGQKDYQQQLVIRRMAADLNMPTEIVSGPTIREEDGLAKSSRNQYLSEAERDVAPQLYATLEDVARQLRAGGTEYGELEKKAVQELVLAGFVPDYVSIRRGMDLDEPGPDCNDFVVLAAARLGGARLIDNIEVKT